MTAVAWRRSADAAPLLIGHRGCLWEPENTLEAFAAALERGAAGIECDVRLDANAQVVVFHDATLERMTQRDDWRPIGTLSSLELSRVRLAHGARIPSLAEVLDWAASAGALVNVELKANVATPAELVRRVLDEVRRARQPRESLLLSSFDARIVRGLTQLAPELSSAHLVDVTADPRRTLSAWRALGAYGIHASAPLVSEAAVEVWRGQGAWIAAWTVNELEDARRLAAWGVDALLTDDPEALRPVLAPR